jgi:hypothetical protein
MLRVRRIQLKDFPASIGACAARFLSSGLAPLEWQMTI